MRIYLFSFAIALLAAACGGNASSTTGDEKFTAEQQAAQQEAFDNMMSIHDVAMEKIAEMNRVARGLKPYRDSLQDEALIEEVDFAIERLEGAEEAMMQWMANSPKLGKMRDTLNHEQVIVMLEAEQEKINEIGDAMTSSLETGQALLARLKQ